MFTNHYDYLYVEPSSYCNLQCPRCPRTTDKQDYKPHHLDLQIFSKFTSSPQLKNTNRIEFGGNYGDPIFHPQLSEMVNIAKYNCPEAEILIHTSGNRDPNWWTLFLEVMSKNDSILFSIDGLKDSNQLYRVQSNWDWIEAALDLCCGRVEVIWKFIVFKHNQHQILEAISLAKDKGVDKFLLTKSRLFNGSWKVNGSDPLAPDEKWIAKSTFTEKIIEPQCQSSSKHYLSANGTYSPCCWMDFAKDYSISLNEQNLSQHEAEEIFNNETLVSLKKHGVRPLIQPAKVNVRVLVKLKVAVVIPNLSFH